MQSKETFLINMVTNPGLGCICYSKTASKEISLSLHDMGILL